jgi:hypothetical protein
MKSFTLLILLLFAFSASAQAPTPAHLPGEPRHHLKIDNQYVRAYYVEVAPHDETQLHQHDHDYIFVSLGAADIVNAVYNKPEVHLVMKDGEIHFSRGGFAHVAKNLSDAPFRNITIEFLKPQGDAKNLCEKVVPGETGPCAKEDHINEFTKTPLFETNEIRADSIELQPKAVYRDVPETGTLLVALDQADLAVQLFRKPEVKLTGTDMLWISGKTSLTIRNAGDGLSRFLAIRFKDVEVSATH